IIKVDDEPDGCDLREAIHKPDHVVTDQHPPKNTKRQKVRVWIPAEEQDSYWRPPGIDARNQLDHIVLDHALPQLPQRDKLRLWRCICIRARVNQHSIGERGQRWYTINRIMSVVTS